MSSLKKLLQSNFFIRLTSWEYWPFGIVQFPFFIYWLWLSLRARSIFFFTASNPCILMGGMLGESKFDILQLIPNPYKPRTILVKVPVEADQLIRILTEKELHFPLIFKPDLGERGFMVKRIYNTGDVHEYLQKIKSDFLVQELIDLPMECGVFYTRFPNEEKGTVTSLVLKEMLTVTGNGIQSLQELILDKPRAKLQWEVLKGVFAYRLPEIIKEGEIVTLVAIGNHCLGTKFLDGENYINEKLSNTFDIISKQIPGFYFGRYDLRCASIEDLYEGKIKIMELNGCGAEPAHIYQPGYSLFKALGVLFTHWRNLFTVSMQNHKRGVKFVSFKEGRIIYRNFKATVQ
jgi:hypothetical protein